MSGALSIVRAESSLALTLRATVLLVMLHGVVNQTASVLLTILGGGMLLLPRLLRRPAPWMALAAVVSVANLMSWDVIDNHKFLIMYWLVLCSVAMCTRGEEAELRVGARRLLAVVFLLAAAWKVVSGEFITGEFLYATLLTDARFAPVTAGLTGMSVMDVLEQRHLVDFLGETGDLQLGLPLLKSAPLRMTAVGLSIGAVVLEAGLGLCYLAGGRRAYRWQHRLLALFIVSAYGVFPVLGFAFVLAVMGLASCETDDVERRFTYILLLGAIQLIDVPWRELVMP